jgi:adenylate cyclase
VKKQKKIGKLFAALIIVVMVFAVITTLHLLGVFQYLEYMSYDLRVRLMAGYSRPSNDIVLILLRQDCLDWAQKERGWGWPWPRQAYAEIVDYMNLGGAKSVAFDMIFSEPSIYRNSKQDAIIGNVVNELESAQSAVDSWQPRWIGPLFRRIVGGLRSLSAGQDDASFVAAEKKYGKVVQTVFFSSQTGSTRLWPPELAAPLFQTENFGPLLEHFEIEEGGAQFPIIELGKAAGALGAVTGKPDSDGVIRRLRIFTLFDGKAVPGISAASLIVSGKGQKISYDKKSSALQWENYSIPVNNKGETLLRYRGEIDRYNPYRAMDILQSAEAFSKGKEPLLAPENFKDAYVFIGLYAPGLFDIFSTPINSVYAGMGCHVTMLDNLLQGDFIRETPTWLNLLILLVAIGLIVLLTLFSRNISLSVSGILFLVIVIIAVSFIAYGQGLWLLMVTYIAGILAAFITVTLYNYATEGSQKRFIKSAFSQYLSPNVIDQIISDPSQLKLGGEKREMTAVFTDIRSFSTFSEALGDPEKLVELLNFYLTRMSDIVLENKGTIDKYEGDAIIAFFGAPVRLSNHASLACRAVVNMKKSEVCLNREALAQGLITPKVLEALTAKGILKSADDPCPVFTRLGVNTGDMVVGNMGTLKKMDYTIMGNAVNLAARLEGVNKQYNTGGILISEYTRNSIGDEFIVRPLSRVRVVGVNTPMRLYELLDVAREAPSDLSSMVQNWEQGFALYEKQNFSAAQNIFRMIYEKNNADLVARKYMDRCSVYITTPPDAATWDDAVDNLTEK